MAIVRWNPFREIERSEPFSDIERFWDPFREMDTLQRQMNRLFDKLVSTDGGERVGYNFIPSAEIEETNDALHLRLEVPGVDPKDINVEVTAESVTISGERKYETRTEENGVTRSEFRYGKFQRVIPLPTRIKHDKVQAECKNGILQLTLPKAESEQGKAIKVNLS